MLPEVNRTQTWATAPCNGGKLLRVLHITNSSEASVDGRKEGRGCNVYEEQRSMQRAGAVRDADVHLLPVFALPPRGVKMGRGRREKDISAHHHKHWEERTGETGQTWPSIGLESNELILQKNTSGMQ